jgi:hypothetical protein
MGKHHLHPCLLMCLSLLLAPFGCTSNVEQDESTTKKAENTPPSTNKLGQEGPGTKRVEQEDPSIVYTAPHRMNSGGEVRNGIAYDQTVLCTTGIKSLVVPEWGTVVEHHERANVLVIYLAKEFDFTGHVDESFGVVDQRPHMGCVVKKEQEKLWIGTFGEWVGMYEKLDRVKLRIVVPPKLMVAQEKRLHGGFGAVTEDGGKNLAPARGGDLKSLTEKTGGQQECWLHPPEEGEWYKIPCVPDPQRRAKTVK